jgi:hypothetical protein
MRSHPLKELSLALIAARVGSQASTAPEAVFLTQFLQRIGLDPAALPAAIQLALIEPCPEDARLVKLARVWGFSAPEVLAVALAVAVDEDVMTGRALAFAQAPLAGSRPTLGLLAAAFGDLTENGYLTPGSLAGGPAFQSGMLVLGNDQAPYPERTVAVPMPLTLALAGHDSAWPKGTIGNSTLPVPLPETTLLACQRHAKALRTEDAPVLVIRSASIDEARAAAAQVARRLKLHPFFANANVEVNGLAAWLLLRRMLPIFLLDPAPSETKAVPTIPFYRGPSLVVSGLEGGFEAQGLDVINWTLPVPNVDERAALWREALGDSDMAASLARAHRLGAARISQLGRLARHGARFAERSAPEPDLVIEALRSGEGSALESLAQLIPDRVPEEALVLCPEVRIELEALLARCRHRDGLAASLGISAATRYSAGVRALFTGPSGTGKTLAAGWLATRLGLPLYRVDLASVTSKYIGETEKNLARLLARAERTEALLLFDEADSLFGKRTDVREANDRFANAQTNYLLQRMETFDGIALLTSNSRGRFDAAFARRLDMVIEFPPPAVSERRALWEAHLGDNHLLTLQELNLLAGQCDFAGGQIRNVVFAAAVAARENGGKLDFPKILRSLAAECRKAGRPSPPGLAMPRVTPISRSALAASAES